MIAGPMSRSAIGDPAQSGASLSKPPSHSLSLFILCLSLLCRLLRPSSLAALCTLVLLTIHFRVCRGGRGRREAANGARNRSRSGPGEKERERTGDSVEVSFSAQGDWVQAWRETRKEEEFYREYNLERVGGIL